MHAEWILCLCVVSFGIGAVGVAYAVHPAIDDLLLLVKQIPCDKLRMDSVLYEGFQVHDYIKENCLK